MNIVDILVDRASVLPDLSARKMLRGDRFTAKLAPWFLSEIDAKRVTYLDWRTGLLRAVFLGAVNAGRLTMGVVSATQQMAAEEFIAAPVPEHGRPWNLIDGEVVVNFPTLRHGQARDNLLLAVKLWTRSGSDRGRAGSPADIGLDDRNVFAPDVLWYAAGRVPAPDAPPPYPMPDLGRRCDRPPPGVSTWGSRRRGTSVTVFKSCGSWTSWPGLSSSIAGPARVALPSMSRSSSPRTSD